MKITGYFPFECIKFMGTNRKSRLFRANVESHSHKMYFLYLKMQDIGQCNGQKKFLVRFRHCLYPILSSQNQFGFGLRHEIKIKQNLNQMFWEKKTSFFGRFWHNLHILLSVQTHLVFFDFRLRREIEIKQNPKSIGFFFCFFEEKTLFFGR